MADGIDKFAYNLGSLARCCLQQEMRRVDFDDFQSGLNPFDQLSRRSRNYGVFVSAQVEHGYLHSGKFARNVCAENGP